MFNDHGDSMALGGFNAAMQGAAEGNRNLNDIAGNVMQAFQNENESRVAQAREMRRMQHEKDMEQMRINALLQRLQAQQRPSGPATGFAQDPNTRQWFRA